MKSLLSGLLIFTSLQAFANNAKIIHCDYKIERDINASIADSISRNNSSNFYSSSNYLFSVLPALQIDKDWNKVGAVAILIDKKGMKVSDLYLCLQNENGRTRYEVFQLEQSLDISKLVKNKSLTLDLDHQVYMGDEHLAAPGSTLTAKASDVEGKDHLVEVLVKLNLNICDVTEQSEEESEADPDCNTTHNQINGSFKLVMPKNMSLN